MSLPGKILKRGPRDWTLATEALLLLGFFRVCLAVMPARRIVSAITWRRSGGTAQGSATSERAIELARRVQWAVSAVARNSAVEFVCFPQTLAAYVMLRRRGISSTMVYGVARSPAGDLVAHTWLTLGDRIVVGGQNAGDFRALEQWG